MNKMFKKATTLALAATLALGALTLTACGDSGKKTTAKKTHDPVTLQVTGKETFEPHNYVDGKCKFCDDTTKFLQDPLFKSKADYLTTACDEQGTVEEITYTYTTNDGAESTKIAYVYLPFGYNADDTAAKYDVLYMVHGKGLNEGYWFAQGSYKPDDGIYTSGFGTQNVLDHMMKDGLAKKCIIVTPSYYKTGTQEGDSDFGKELTESLMPYVAENYNTYAASGSAEDLKANRDHQGYTGLSLGSMYSYSIILSNYVDYFAWVGSFSGSSFGEDSWKTIGENLSANWAAAPLKYWYAGVGSTETNTAYPGDPFNAYRTVVANCSAFKAGSDLAAGNNCAFMLTTNTGHNYATWVTDLYNCLLVFFQA